MPTALELIRDFNNDLPRMRECLDTMQFKEGLALVHKYNGLFEKNAELRKVHGYLATKVHDFRQAEWSFGKLVKLQPENGAAVNMYAKVLDRTGRRAEAIAMLEAYQARCPQDIHSFDAYLPLILVERGLDATIEVLKAEVMRRGSTAPLAPIAIEIAREKALAMFGADAIRQADPDDLLRIHSTASDGKSKIFEERDLKLIYENFEPIGCNCEFGFVQREAGLEPLQLMRWTSIRAENLPRFLGDDLEGYGRPEIYRLHGNPQHEYMLHDTLYGTLSHTGVNSSDLSEDEFLARVTRRQAFLTRKFLSDAAAGKKIFVHKADRPLSEKDIEPIERELLRMGVRRMIFVMPDPEPGRPGTIEAVSPHRLLGYLSSVHPRMQFGEWNRLAIAAYDHFIAPTLPA